MWNIMKKEFRRRWRSPIPSATMLLFPFLMAGMIGTVSGGGGGPTFPVIDVMMLDRDESFVSQALTTMAGNEDFGKYIRLEVVGEEGFSRIEHGDASALVVLPEGFSETVLAGDPTIIEVIRNPAEGIKPEIVTQGMEVVATYLDQASRVMGEELDLVIEMFNQDSFPDPKRVAELAEAVMAKLGTAERFIFPPVATIETTKEGGEDSGPAPNVFGYVLVMVAVMSVLFVGSRTMLDFFDEEKTGMMRRQLTTPATISLLVRSKMVFGVVFGVVVMALVLGAGWALRWLTWPVDLLGIAVLTVALAMASCGVIGLVFSLCRTDKQAAGMTWLVIMGMSALGGSMAPIDAFPEAMQLAGRFTLNYWAVDGYTELFMERNPIGSVLKNIGILVGVGLVTMLLAQRIIEAKYRRWLP